MTETVEIQPATAQRRAFAQWARSQNPRIETASATTSRVPVALFTSIPEEILVGSKIDGTPYRSVIEGLAPDGPGYQDAPADQDTPDPYQDPATVIVDAVDEEPKTPARRTRRGTK